MKKKRLATFVVTMMAVLISCFGSISTYANAFDNTIEAIAGEGAGMLRYVAIIRISNSLTLSSGGKLTCIGSTAVQPAYKAGVKIELQQKNGSWTTIQTWDETSTTSTKTIEKDRYVDPGTYRLKLTHTAKNSDGSVKETDSDYSREVVVP